MLRPGVSIMTKDSDVAPTKLDRIKRVVQNAIQLNRQIKKERNTSPFQFEASEV